MNLLLEKLYDSVKQILRFNSQLVNAPGPLLYGLTSLPCFARHALEKIKKTKDQHQKRSNSNDINYQAKIRQKGFKKV